MAGTNHLRLELARGIDGLEKLAPDWARLLEQLPDPNYLQLPGWHRSFLDNLADDPARAVTCALYDGAAPVAIIPLYRSESRIGGIAVTALELPTHEHMHHGDLLVAPGWEGRVNLAALLPELATRGPSFDVLVLGPVLAGSSASAVCRASKPWLTAVEPGKRSDWLATGAYEPLLDRLSKNFKGNLRKARNKLEKTADVRVLWARTPEELGPAFERFLTVEASGWKGQAGTGTAIANDARLRGFYQGLVDRLGPAGQLEINVLLMGEVPIAAQLAVVVGRRYHLLKIGYDEAYGQLAPGNMLLERLLRRHENDRRISCVDLVSDAAWHDSWKPEMRPAERHLLFRPTTKGLLAWAALQGRQVLRPVRRRVVQRWNQLFPRRAVVAPAPDGPPAPAPAAPAAAGPVEPR
jgi:CelD/BcsL family acetyltransferase involved in cellulose biosynthesis